MLTAGRGKRFDPEVLDAFLGCRGTVEEIQSLFRDPAEGEGGES
jgi:HD-GYP domain-containing protein (c-di-GMP phosphodiesterase class II)